MDLGSIGSCLFYTSDSEVPLLALCHSIYVAFLVPYSDGTVGGQWPVCSTALGSVRSRCEVRAHQHWCPDSALGHFKLEYVTVFFLWSLECLCVWMVE